MNVQTNLPMAFPLVGGTVNTSASDGAGGWFIGGNFSHVGGLPRYGLAHILADGNVSDWQPYAYGVSQLIVVGDTVYVSGVFTEINKIERIGIAAIDMDGKVTSWHPQVWSVHAMEEKMELFISG